MSSHSACIRSHARIAYVLRASRLIALCVAIALCGPSARAAPPSSDDWTLVREEDAITSWMRERGGDPLPSFRARTVMASDLFDILAVLEDVDRACEWTAHCQLMRRIRAPSPRSMLVYARMDAPWPVHDRDVVTRVSVDYAESGTVVAKIESLRAAEVPPVPGVVRMPKLSASYRLRIVDARHTEVQYELQTDPGGALPDWLKRLVSRDLAHQTLLRLRERARWAEERGVYQQRAAQLRDLARITGFRS